MRAKTKTTSPAYVRSKVMTAITRAVHADRKKFDVLRDRLLAAREEIEAIQAAVERRHGPRANWLSFATTAEQERVGALRKQRERDQRAVTALIGRE